MRDVVAVVDEANEGELLVAVPEARKHVKQRTGALPRLRARAERPARLDGRCGTLRDEVRPYAGGQRPMRGLDDERGEVPTLESGRRVEERVERRKLADDRGST